MTALVDGRSIIVDEGVAHGVRRGGKLNDSTLKRRD